MDKKKREIIITACLIIVFIWFVANGARTRLKRKEIYKSTKAMVVNVGAGFKPAPTPPTSVAKVTLGSGFGRDPFSRQAVAPDGRDAINGVSTSRQGDIAGISLTGIIYDTENYAENYCVINNEVVMLGESVSGFTLAGIKEDSVILTNEKEGKDYCLSLWDDGS